MKYVIRNRTVPSRMRIHTFWQSNPTAVAVAVSCTCTVLQYTHTHHRHRHHHHQHSYASATRRKKTNENRIDGKEKKNEAHILRLTVSRREIKKTRASRGRQHHTNRKRRKGTRRRRKENGFDGKRWDREEYYYYNTCHRRICDRKCFSQRPASKLV